MAKEGLDAVRAKEIILAMAWSEGRRRIEIADELRVMVALSVGKALATLMVAEARYIPIPPGEQPVVFGFSGRLIIRSGFTPEIALEPLRLANSTPGGEYRGKPKPG